jgi:hypothetical protein
VNAHTNLSATADVDFHDNNLGGTTYPNGTATEITADATRPQFAGVRLQHRPFGQNEWVITHGYPAGNYNVWGRFVRLSQRVAGLSFHRDQRSNRGANDQYLGNLRFRPPAGRRLPSGAMATATQTTLDVDEHAEADPHGTAPFGT